MKALCKEPSEWRWCSKGSQFLAMEWGRTTTARDGGFARRRWSTTSRGPWGSAQVLVEPRASPDWARLCVWLHAYTVGCLRTAENQPKISQKKFLKKLPKKNSWKKNSWKKFAKILPKILPEKFSQKKRFPRPEFIYSILRFPQISEWQTVPGTFRYDENTRKEKSRHRRNPSYYYGDISTRQLVSRKTNHKQIITF